MKKAQVSYEDVERKKKQLMWMNNNNKINMNLRLDTTQRYSVEDECSKKVFFQLKSQIGYKTKIFDKGGGLRNKK